MKKAVARFIVIVLLLSITHSTPYSPTAANAQGVSADTDDTLLFGSGLSSQSRSFLMGKLLLDDMSEWMYARRNTLDTDIQFSAATVLNTLKANHPGASETFQPILNVAIVREGGTPLKPHYALDETTGTITINARRTFTPGLYTVSIDATDPLSGISQRTEQDFAWGVLAMNPDKDSYTTGETARIDFGVLNERGDIVCDAELTLIIHTPTGNSSALSTQNGAIATTGSCGNKAAGFIEPDYRAALPLHEAGTYALELLAKTKNGTWTISSSIAVSDSAPVRIKRTAATRLWPFAPSSMNIQIFFTQDFSGTITDTVPEGFAVTQTQPHATAQNTNDALGAGQTLSWHGSWKSGEVAEFSYTYDAPDISPEFYLLGPLILSPATGGDALHELRSWQIANDVGEGWLSGYSYRKKITIDNTYVDSDLTDFPLYVKISADSDVGTYAQSDGDDIRFTSSGGLTVLPHEEESFSISSGSGSGNFWVKVPTVFGASDTIIYMYYGSGSAVDGQDVANVWDVNFVMVHHLKDATTSTVTDSKDSYTGTKSSANNPIEAIGNIYNGQDFSNDLIGFGDVSAIDGITQLTIMVWSKFDGIASDYEVAAKGNHTWPTANDKNFLLFRDETVGAGSQSGNTNTLSVIVSDGTDMAWSAASSTSINDTNWHYVGFTFLALDATGLKPYVDGANSTSASTSAVNNTRNIDANNLLLGKAMSAGVAMDGRLDEFRVSTTIRSNAWIKFEYNNMAQSDQELAWGSAERQWPSGFTKRKKITIDHTYVDSDLMDFPLYVRFTADSDIGASAQNDGDDIRFATATGLLLYFEEDSFSVSSGSGTGNFWVKIPKIYGSINTDIYMYYGSGSAVDGQNVTGVWDSNFKGVWHIPNGTTLGLLDSTENNNDGTNVSATATAGVVDGGVTTDGGTKYVTIGDPAMFDFGANDFTVSAWAYRNTGFGSWDTIVVGKWNTGGSPGTNEWDLAHGGVDSGTETLPGFIIHSGTTSHIAKSPTATSNNTWYYLTGQRTGTNIKIFVNGVDKKTTAVGAVAVNNVSGRNVRFAKIDGGAYGLNGRIDEVRISSTARPAAWIKFEYNNMAQADYEIAFSSEESNGTLAAGGGGGKNFFYFFGF